jgi:hypothetical protein
MITHADIGRLLHVRAAGPTVLSLYLRVPSDPSALPGLPARADGLLARTGRGSTDDPDTAAAQDEDRRIAADMLEVNAREWLVGTIGVFACGEPRLAETIVLPCGLSDRAVFATRPHVRPLLLARQRPAGYDMAADPPGRHLPEQLRMPPQEALTAIGLQACLTAVNQRAADLLIVPEDGMIPGFVCQRCTTLSGTGTDCPDWGAASLAVPDLIEEMVVTALGDGAEVQAVRDPPGGIAARLRFPSAYTGEPALPGAATATA